MEIKIQKTNATYWASGSYMISSGDRFISELTFDEMLGFVAAWGLQCRELFRGMRTYEEHITDWPHRFFPNDQIAGLLGCDPAVQNPIGTVAANFLFNPAA